MDKQGYREFLEAIMEGYENGDYEMVASFADEIDLRKIKEVKILEAIADSYSNLNEYRQAREALLAAYQQSPTNRQVSYKLSELCIKLDDLDSAVEFYDEFCKLSGRDSKQLILKYEIGKAGGIPKSELIKVLKAYVQRERDEKWEYELARLYHETGQADKCVETCDDIVLWYSNGEYVKKALELKFAHKPLTVEQQAKYERIMSAYLEPEERTWENQPNEEPKYSQLEEQMAEEFTGEFMGEFSGGDLPIVRLQKNMADEQMQTETEELAEEEPQGGFWGIMKEKQEEDEDRLVDTRVIKLADVLAEIENSEDEREEDPEDYPEDFLPEDDKYKEETKDSGMQSLTMDQLRSMIVAGSINAISQENDIEPDVPDEVYEAADDEPDEVFEEEAETEYSGEIDEKLADRKEFADDSDEEGYTRVISRTELFASLAEEEKQDIPEEEPQQDLSQTLKFEVQEINAALSKKEEIPVDTRSATEVKLGEALAGILGEADAFLEEASTTKVIYVDIGVSSGGKLGIESARLSPLAKLVIKPDLCPKPVTKEEDEEETAETETDTQAGRLFLDSVDISYMALAREDDGQYGFDLEYITEEDETIEGQISFYDVYESYQKKLEENKDQVAAVEAERLRMIQEAVNIGSKVVLPYDMNDLTFEGIEVEEAFEANEDGPEGSSSVRGHVAAREQEMTGATVVEAEEIDAAEPEEFAAEAEEIAAEPEEFAAEAEVVAAEPDEFAAEAEEIAAEPEGVSAETEERISKLVFPEEESFQEDKPFTRRFAEEDDFEEDVEDEVFRRFEDIVAEEAEEKKAEHPETAEITETAEPAEDEEKTATEYEAETGNQNIGLDRYVVAEEKAASPSEPLDEFVASKAEVDEEEDAAEAPVIPEAPVKKKKSELWKEEPEKSDMISPYIEAHVSESGYSMPDEIREEITEFMLIEGMEEKITDAISDILGRKRAGDPTGGNLVVTGDAKSGKTYLSIAVIKAVAQELGKGNGRVAKIQATSLNGKNMDMVFGKINGCDLIIENVGYLEDRTVLELQRIITEGQYDSMVILEGNQLAVENIFNSYPELKEEFKNRIDISELSIVQWADIAVNYADERGFVLDDMARLALHAKINEMNLPTVRLGYDDILDVMDEAIAKAEKRNTGKLFSAFKKNSKEKKEILESDFA